MTFFYSIVATFAIATGAIGRNMDPSSRLFFNFALPGLAPKPAPAPINICMAPAGCLMGITFLCPPCYTGGSGGGGSGTTPADLEQQRNAALANGNSYRATHTAPPMTRDPTLDAAAQAYADKLCSTRAFQHDMSIAGTQGENLARIPSGPNATIAKANDYWYGEKAGYCPPTGVGKIDANPSSPTMNGHFTQMVWKSSTNVGYGSKVCSDGYTYVVARYTTPGNYAGMEATEVSC